MFCVSDPLLSSVCLYRLLRVRIGFTGDASLRINYYNETYD